MANIIDLSKLDEKLDTILSNQKKIQDAGVPKQETTALTESLAKPTKDYKSIVAKAFRDSSSQPMNSDALVGERFKEAIGEVDGVAAVPTIWAKDVMRCCPYPASAFLGAPFIRYLEAN